MSDQYFTPPAGAVEAPVWELSGWWRRVGAQVIDGFLIAIPSLIIAAVVASLGFNGIDNEVEAESWFQRMYFVLIISQVVVASIYYCLIMPRTNGQTVGKMATEIRVVREDGQEMTAGFAFVREILVITILFNLLGRFLLSIPTLLNYLWPLWDSKNQALHDKIVKSRVVRAGQVTELPPQPQVPVVQGSDGAPKYTYTPPQPTQPQVPPPPAPPTPAATPAPPAPTPAPPAPTVEPPAAPSGPPPPPVPGGTPTPYTPPPGYENPVPDDD